MARPLTTPYVKRRDCRYCGESFFVQHAGRHEKGHESFWASVQKTDGCWLWSGAVSEYGYGHAPRTVEQYAHRLAYRWLVGPIPQGFQVDHLCFNKLCVNPAHLEAVPRAENIRRSNVRHSGSFQRSKTHCPKGHPYRGRNLYVTREGWRQCRTCSVTRTRNARAAVRMAVPA